MPTSSTDAGWASSIPFVLYPEDADDGAYDGHFGANMIVCVESYVGALDGPQGVKLEQPVLITDHGPEVLSELPLDAADFPPLARTGAGNPARLEQKGLNQMD